MSAIRNCRLYSHFIGLPLCLCLCVCVCPLCGVGTQLDDVFLHHTQSCQNHPEGWPHNPSMSRSNTQHDTNPLSVEQCRSWENDAVCCSTCCTWRNFCEILFFFSSWPHPEQEAFQSSLYFFSDSWILIQCFRCLCLWWQSSIWKSSQSLSAVVVIMPRIHGKCFPVRHGFGRKILKTAAHTVAQRVWRAAVETYAKTQMH